MTDTSPAMATLQRRLVMARTGAERLQMGCAMFDAARTLMRAGLCVPPGADLSPDLRVQLFLRTYGRDFDAATAARIIAHLRAAPVGTEEHATSIGAADDRHGVGWRGRSSSGV